jgi:hypothetical protein
MDEREIAPNGGFAELRGLLAGVVAEIVEIGRPAAPLPMAAE